MFSLEKRDIFRIFNILAVLAWMIVLKESDAFYGGYFLSGVLAIAIIILQKTANWEIGIRDKWAIRGVSGFLSLAVALANYRLIVRKLYWGVMLYAGYTVAERLLNNLYVYLSKADQRRTAENPKRYKQVFISVFLAITALNTVYLVFANYPGSLSPDSIWQIEQILTGEYSNHHPYWHTRFVGIFVRLGMSIFHDLNAAIALYNVVQIMLMAACFAFAVMTLYQARLRFRYVMIPAILYTVMPYHIIYSTTIWKDVLFGGVMLLMIVSLYRMMANIGKRRRNGVLLFVGLVGVALFRSNGYLTLLGAFVAWFLFFGRRRTKVALLFAAVLIISWGLKNPVLDHLEVQESNFRESLSIPIQQVARVIALDADITDEQKQELNKVVDVDRIPQWYAPHISDPVKFNVDGEYIRNHQAEFLKLWLDIGLRNPGVYIEAWIEQTKGYWNEGYDYWIWYSGASENDFGIRSTRSGGYEGFRSLGWPRIFEPLFSIGMHTWLLLVFFVFNCLWGEKEKAYLAVPVLLMIGTLLVATPVYSEFRYAYSLFTVLPTYTMMSVLSKKHIA